MPEPELCLLFVRPLNRLGIRYLVSGSIAAILYGEPRLTHDVDFVVFLRPDDVSRLLTAFPSPDFYAPTREIIVAELARDRHGHFNIIHSDTGFKADFYLAGREELHAWAFRHSRRLDYEGEPLVAASPEYVIIRKLEFYREGGSDKHLRDIRSMLAVSGAHIDHAALNEWVTRRDLSVEWRQACSP